jgi:hypothetical protein
MCTQPPVSPAGEDPPPPQAPLSRTRYQYPDDDKDLGYSLSGASYVEDVNEDPVVIINGLTKGFR